MRPVAFRLAFLLVLAACGGNDAPAYTHTAYLAPAGPGGRICAGQCKASQDYCAQSCGLDYRACYNDVQARAMQQYDQYTRARFNGKLNVDMRPSDFEHPEICEHDRRRCVADCEKPYNACYASCGGTVTTQSSCQFLCFE